MSGTDSIGSTAYIGFIGSIDSIGSTGGWVVELYCVNNTVGETDWCVMRMAQVCLH